MPAKRYPLIDESIERSLIEVLGRTEGGLTNKQIDEVLAAAGIADPTPPAPAPRVRDDLQARPAV